MKYHVLPHEGGFVVAHQMAALGGWIADSEPLSGEAADQQAESLNRSWLAQCQLQAALRAEQAAKPRRALRWFPNDEFA